MFLCLNTALYPANVGSTGNNMTRPDDTAEPDEKDADKI